QDEWAFGARPTRGRNQQNIRKRTLRRDPFEVAHHVRFLSRKGRMAFESGEKIVDHLNGHVSEDAAFLGEFLRSSTESTSPVIGDQFKVPGIHVGSGGNDVAFAESPTETLLDRDLLAGSHLVRGRDQQAVRMRANVKPKVLWTEAIAPHALDLLHKFFGGFGDVG